MGKFNRYTTILCLMVVLFCSCKNEAKSVRVLLDYSYESGWAYSYSVKIYTNGLAYLKRNNLKTDSFYVKNHIDINQLNEIISKAQKRKIANKYEDSLIQDASSFNVIIYYVDGKTSKHYVYGDHYPDLLRQIKDYCNTLSEAKGWNRAKDTVITFLSMANFHYIPKIMDTDTYVLPPPNLK